MTTGIYKIEALCPVARMARQAIYIGQSKNIEARWKQHCKRFPKDQYSYEILLACDDQYLDFFEKAFIDGYGSHRCGLNKTIGGSAIKSRYPDAETRAKISAANKGRPAANKGKSASQETRARISAAQQGRPRSDETKAKISAARQGKTTKPCSEETKAKISAAHKRRHKAQASN